MKRVLITGGTGFVGACLTRTLLARGHEVHLLVRPGHKDWRIRDLRGEVQVHACNLDDQAGLKDNLQQIHPDWIFHLAAYGAYVSQVDLTEMFHTNLAGLSNLLTACLQTGFEAFINAGSSSEYGLKDHAPLESEELEPNSNYAVSKASATLYCGHIARSRGVNIKTLRLYSVYGPYEEPSRLIPRLITFGMRGKYPPLVNPEVRRDFVFVEDVCRAFELSAEGNSPQPGAVYNVGTGTQSTIGDTVQLVREILDIQDTPHWGSMPERSWDTTLWVANPQKISTETKWQPQFNLEQGIRRVVAWFREHPDMRAYYEQMSDYLPT